MPNFEEATIVIEPRRPVVHIRGMPVHLTPSEYRILRRMAQEPNTVQRYEELMTAMVGHPVSYVGRGLDVQVCRLRKKLDIPPDDPVIRIVSQRAFGYELVCSEEIAAVLRGPIDVSAAPDDVQERLRLATRLLEQARELMGVA